MGTNYYVETHPPCEKCGREYKQLHIGKSSFGWVFHLHIYPEDGINDLPDWERIFNGEVYPKVKIVDEYDRPVTAKAMLQHITQRRGVGEKYLPPGYKDWAEFYKDKDYDLGPNNLLRLKIDGTHVVGHGSGTWDLNVGEFS